MDAPNQSSCAYRLGPNGHDESNYVETNYSEHSAPISEGDEMAVDNCFVFGVDAKSEGDRGVSASFNDQQNTNGEEDGGRGRQVSFAAEASGLSNESEVSIALNLPEMTQVTSQASDQLQKAFVETRELADELFSALTAFLDDAAAVQKDFQQVSQSAEFCSAFHRAPWPYGTCSLTPSLLKKPQQVQNAVLAESDRLDTLQPTVENATRGLLLCRGEVEH